MANIAQSLIGDLESITVADPREVQGVHPTLPAIQYDETKLFHRIFKINEIKSTKQNQHLLYIGTPFPGILDPPLHQDVYLENSLISIIQTAALLPYGFPLFRKNKSALSYYGSAEM